MCDKKNFTIDYNQFKELYSSNETYNNELWETVDILKESNEQYLALLTTATQQLNELTNTDSPINNVNTLYIELREQYEKSQEEIKTLKSLNENLQIVITNIKENLAKEYSIDIVKAKNECTETITKYENITAALKADFEIKEAFSAFKFDEMESKLQNMQLEANRKLMDANSSNNVLRSELMTLKNQYNCNTRNTENVNEERIQYLEEKLILTENQLRIVQEKNYNNRFVGVPSNQFSYNQYTKVEMKFNTDEQKQVSFGEKNSINDSIQNNPLPIYINSNKNLELKNKVDNNSNEIYKSDLYNTNWTNKNIAKRYRISPNNNEIKKRKLYNPNNLDYLNDLKLNNPR